MHSHRNKPTVVALKQKGRGQKLPDVTLTDQHTGVVDGLGQATLEHEGLEATLHEVLNLEGQNVIETLRGKKGSIRN